MNSLYGNYRQVKFTDVWNNHLDFVDAYNNSAFPAVMTNDKLNVLFYLLYAEYGNSVIASSDTNQFIYKVFSIIFREGGTWSKELDIQEQLRNMSMEDLQTGSVSISQHGYNPSTPVSSQDEIQTVDDQNKVRYKKSKVEAYANLMALLKRDVSREFIAKFKKLFLTVVMPETPLWYVTDTEEGEDL